MLVFTDKHISITEVCFNQMKSVKMWHSFTLYNNIKQIKDKYHVRLSAHMQNCVVLGLFLGIHVGSNP